jgi:hypothetical protein
MAFFSPRGPLLSFNDTTRIQLHLPNRDTSITDQLGSATRAEKTHVQSVEFFGKVKETGLVIDGKDGYRM